MLLEAYLLPLRLVPFGPTMLTAKIRFPSITQMSKKCLNFFVKLRILRKFKNAKHPILRSKTLNQFVFNNIKLSIERVIKTLFVL